MSMIRIATCAVLAAAQISAVPAMAASAPSALKRVTIRACTYEALQQGLSVRNVGAVETLDSSRGAVIGGQTILKVRRDGQKYDVRCKFWLNQRIARITPVSDAG